jgi:multidrug resistance efflux pump
MRRPSRKMPGDWLFKVVPVFIAIGFVVVIGAWINIGYLAVTTDMADVAREVGKIARAAQDGYQDGRNH